MISEKNAHMHIQKSSHEFFFDSRKDELLRNMHLFSGHVQLVKIGDACSELRPTARNEYRILTKLVKLGSANVYEISRSLKNAGHYSTILRALRRMEKKGLVRTTIEGRKERGQKTYEVTLLGDVVGSLADRDWKSAADKIAAQSSRFRDCQKIGQVLTSDYCHYLTYHIIEDLMYPTTTRDLRTEHEQVETAVAQSNARWIKKKIMPRLNDPEARSDSLDEINEFMNVPWMKPFVIRCLEEYSTEVKDWLRTIDKLTHETA